MSAGDAGAVAAPVLHVTGIGVLGPGLAGWPQARALLRDPAGWQPAPTLLPPPARLPAAERRRSGASVRLSLAVADEACAMAGADAHAIATVFSSSAGEAANCHALCETLASAERAVSPTRFTNSVHNAAAGYWHIATASRAPSTSLCAYDASFGAGLLEAIAQCLDWRRPVLLVCADVPYPQPLAALRPLPDAFGIALLLDPAPAPAASLARLTLHGVAGRDGGAADGKAAGGAGGTSGAVGAGGERAESGEGGAGWAGREDEAGGLDALARTMRAGRALPLLGAIARGRAATLALDDGCGACALSVGVLPAPSP